ncbi:FAD-binding oxidoreductase [Kordiimonas aquimaris]|uniref:FAD-binding oxidoreductase n=1 Tax=Kordiimonas aquimaris TaxID=707591 RepID=UPI0021CFBE51|nr:FAD-binding oxidoreductase [Kordiimonas aquimaris]
MIADHHIIALKALVDANGSTTEKHDLEPFVTEWRDKFIGKTQLMLSPKTTDEVAAIIKYCSTHQITVVPQGGNTGLVGGSTPGINGADEILINLRRMTSVHNVNAEDYSVTVDAGCTVSMIHEAAIASDRLFPLSLASEGSCTAGGVASTNAGGVHVIRYGTTRALVLGVEAVLPDGSIIDALTPLRKDNTGYALAQLMIGAEGTLGIITKVCFKLYPSEKKRSTAWLALPDANSALKLLSMARDITGDQVSVFELMCRPALDFAFNHIPDLRDPISDIYPWYVLLECASSDAASDINIKVQTLLEAALEQNLIVDGAIALSEQQRELFWHTRESLSEAQKHEGGSIKHDISVPVSTIPKFIEAATNAIHAKYPDARVTPFGHMGDGNLHFNVMQPANQAKADFLSHWEDMNRLVHDVVIEFGGSISAEHGIGILKKDELSRTKPSANLAAMRAIKHALDPKNIMNPRVLFSD